MRALAAALLVLGTVACGSRTYTGVGDVVAVDAPAGAVTLRHDDIPGLMDAMTMRFPVASPDVLAGVATGTRVRFDVERRGSALRVTRIVLLGAAGGPRPGVHDHTPHHGGVVAMVGLRHLEARATPDGTIRAWVTDVWRRPLPLEGAEGTATVDVAGTKREVPLTPDGDALAGRGPALDGREAAVGVRVVQGGEPLESHFILPLAGDATGAANVPAAGCRPPETPGPRCVLDFGAAVTVVTPTPDGDVLVAVLNGGVSRWRARDGAFVVGFGAPPPVVAPASEAPHPEAANAVVLRPDGVEAAVALENRVLVYDARDGRFLRTLATFSGIVRSLAWAPDAATVVVTVFYDARAHQLRAADGAEIRALAVEREASAVAVADDGRVAVGSERGAIRLYPPAGDAPARALDASDRSIEAVGFAGPHLVAAGYDGVVRTWDDAGRVTAATPPGGAVLRLAVAPRDRRVAAAGVDPTVRIVDVATGTVTGVVAWHEAAVWGVAWVGDILATGDASGRLAFWPARAP